MTRIEPDHARDHSPTVNEPAVARRSGCAVLSGVLLVAVGSLFLAHNVLSFIGVSPLRAAAHGLAWFGAYWPLILIGWGAYKVYQRLTRPERSYVTAAEIVIFAWIVVAGLAVRGAQHLMDEMAVHVSTEDFASLLGPDLLGPVHRVEETTSFDLEQASALVIETERGRVVVVGSDRPELEVTLSKQINSYSASDAERAMSGVSLEFRSGNEARLATSRAHEARGVVADIEIRVPRALPVRVFNQHGAVRLQALDGPAKVTTSYGNIEASDLSSGIEAETSRGTVRLDRISGSTTARNEHGAVRAHGIDGDLKASTDHDTIVVEDVTGSVTLETTHGNVRVANVAGSVGIDSPYSEVSVEHAGHNVTIAASHRPIHVQDVRGRVQLISRFARVVVRGVAEDVSIDNANRPVRVFDVAGDVSVTGEKSSVEVDAVEGAITVASTHEDIRITSFAARLDIRATDANVDVIPDRIGDEVRIETSRGDVRVSLPPDVSANVSASTRDGELRSEYRNLVSAPSNDARQQRWEGTIGSGSFPITIVTTYGDITLSRAELK